MSHKGTAHSLIFEGLRMRLSDGDRSSSSSETPGGKVIRKCCRRVVKKMKTSVLARFAPGQTLRPEIENKKIHYILSDSNLGHDKKLITNLQKKP